MKIAREMYIRVVQGLPYNTLAEKNPDILRRINDYLFCKRFNVLPEDGGLNDQFIVDVVYFELFSSVEGELDKG